VDKELTIKDLRIELVKKCLTDCMEILDWNDLDSIGKSKITFIAMADILVIHGKNLKSNGIRINNFMEELNERLGI